jgi:hypothetical protein
MTSHRRSISQVRLRTFVCVWAVALALALPQVAFAHDAPEGGEWVMADWMFISFGAFGGMALIAFFICLKMGLLSNIEDAKYPMMEIEEDLDYYTPDWARNEVQRADS